MKTVFRRSFLKDVRGVNRKLGRRIEQVIVEVEQAQSPDEIKNLKKLAGKGAYYRIRIGDYRIGVIIRSDAVIFVRFLHRKDIYRYFP